MYLCVDLKRLIIIFLLTANGKCVLGNDCVCHAGWTGELCNLGILRIDAFHKNRFCGILPSYVSGSAIHMI